MLQIANVNSRENGLNKILESLNQTKPLTLKFDHRYHKLGKIMSIGFMKEPLITDVMTCVFLDNTHFFKEGKLYCVAFMLNFHIQMLNIS